MVFKGSIRSRSFSNSTWDFLMVDRYILEDKTTDITAIIRIHGGFK